MIFLADGRVLTSCTRAEIAEAVGAPVRPKLDAYDLVVAGAGPAGLSAAVYGASEGLSTLVLESTAMGGQAGTSSRIRNFLGFPAGISGSELAERAFQQAWMFGAEFVFINGAAGLSASGERLVVTLAESRVLPTPPGPVTVTSRYCSSRPATARTACSRPTKLVSTAGKPCTPTAAIPAAAPSTPVP